MSLRRLLLWLSPFFLMLLLVVASITSALAAVPNDKATPAYAEEQTILQSEQGQPEPGLGDAASGRQHMDRHYIKPPGLMPEQNVILQRGGNTWRTWRNGPLATIAGTLLLLVPLAILALYRVFGPQRIEGGETGRDIQRFTRLDRWTHWATAITFLAMAATGLVILFGKQLLLPWMGHDAFSWLAIISKYAHNILGPLFILCSLAMFFTFVRRNRFERADWQWVKAGGGLVSHAHVPAPYFNFGEKMWFWLGVTLLGGLMALTGLMLNFPYFAGNTPGPGFTRYLLQWANMLHLLGAAAYIAFAMGHIYLGTLGSPGAYRGMRHGAVDEAWVRTHHELWWRQIIARDRGATTGRR
ncbi:formate dehydrogenase subunit gamma [Azohydromonas lata]|uniref:Formate dehydrogenase subunit gamma n=1 Tax=Azohydromonas lata TaxID=45677 RepID=A0ABU5ID45_9BURK|nr:formate dehydrogenase subunit gamma [Azohydromonas lata]MDZ5457048.1 formate dehydrogenase subunit gamma [Azohydromonas lata]